MYGAPLRHTRPYEREARGAKGLRSVMTRASWQAYSGDVRSRPVSQQPAIPRVKRRCLLTGGRFHAARITLSERYVFHHKLLVI